MHGARQVRGRNDAWGGGVDGAGGRRLQAPERALWARRRWAGLYLPPPDPAAPARRRALY